MGRPKHKDTNRDQDSSEAHIQISVPGRLRGSHTCMDIQESHNSFRSNYGEPRKRAIDSSVVDVHGSFDVYAGSSLPRNTHRVAEGFGAGVSLDASPNKRVLKADDNNKDQVEIENKEDMAGRKG